MRAAKPETTQTKPFWCRLADMPPAAESKLITSKLVI
jgi:hypothetical protein